MWTSALKDALDPLDQRWLRFRFNASVDAMPDSVDHPGPGKATQIHADARGFGLECFRKLGSGVGPVVVLGHGFHHLG